MIQAKIRKDGARRPTVRRCLGKCDLLPTQALGHARRGCDRVQGATTPTYASPSLDADADARWCRARSWTSPYDLRTPRAARIPRCRLHTCPPALALICLGIWGRLPRLPLSSPAERALGLELLGAVLSFVLTGLLHYNGPSEQQAQ